MKLDRFFVSAIVGYSVFQALPGVFVGATNLLFFGQDGMYSTAQLFAKYFTIAQVATLLFLAVTSCKIASSVYRVLPPIANVLLLLGLFFLTIHSLSASSTSTLLVAAALVLGCSYSGIFLTWMSILALRPFNESIFVVTIGTFGSGLLNAGMYFARDIEACFLILAISSVVHFAIVEAITLRSPFGESLEGLCAASAEKCGQNSPCSQGVVQRCLGFVRSQWRSILSVSVIGFAGGVARAMLVAEGDGNMAFLSSMFFVGSLVGSVVLLLFSRRIEHIRSFSSVFWALFFVSATAFLFVPLSPIAYLSILVGAENMLFSIASMCMIFLCLRLIERQPSSLVLIVGLFVGLVYAGVGLGQIFGSYIGQEFNYIVVSVLSVYIVLLVGLFTNIKKEKQGRFESEEERPAVLVSEISEDRIRSSEVFRDQYKLSNREIDVLILALNGRNAPSIAEKLFVSENTVRTHLKRIYKKLDIHNRQELLQLIENVFQ